MRRWTTGLLAGLLLVLAGWVLAPAASACSCAGGTAADHALRADAVFSGRLVSREAAGGTVLHVFAVDTVYAGEVSARQGVPAPGARRLVRPGARRGGTLPRLRRPRGRPAGGRPVRRDDGVDPGAAAEVQVLTGARSPEPGTAGTGPPGGPSGAVLEAGAAVLLVGAFVGGLLLRRRAAG